MTENNPDPIPLTSPIRKPGGNRLPDILAALTVLIFTSVAVLLQLFWIGRPLRELFSSEMSGILQAVIGVATGSLIAEITFLSMKSSKKFSRVKDISYEMIKLLNPSLRQAGFIALAAGWGEELLFRGVLQPRIGNVLASILFAGIHVGFNVKDVAKRHYFVSVFIVSIGLGAIYHFLGLIAAMTAHASWDFVMLINVKRDCRSRN